MQEKKKDKLKQDLLDGEKWIEMKRQKMDSCKKNVKILNGNLIIWNKYRLNIEKWIFGKLISLTF